MPSGAVHIKIWKKFSPAIFFIALITSFFSWYVAIFVLFGWLLHGFGIDPDLDLSGINRSEALWTDLIIFIPLIGWSTFYSRIFRGFGGHRSIWTHGFFISTFIRLMFFGFPFVYWFRIYWADDLFREFLGMFIGLSVADSLHIIADMITGEMNFGKKEFKIPFKLQLKNILKKMEKNKK